MNSTTTDILDSNVASAMQEAVDKQTVGNITGFYYAICPGTGADLQRLLESHWSVVEQTTSCPVRVGRSNIHGQGVFAARDILAGETVTFYPVDGVESLKTKTTRVLSPVNVSRSRLVDVRQSYSCGVHCGVHVGGSEVHSIIGEPKINADMRQVGHLLNDGCPFKMPKFDSENSMPTFGWHVAFFRRQKIHRTVSALANNIAFKKTDGSLTVRMVATKDIASGEELLVSYGVEYWIGRSHALTYPLKWQKQIVGLLHFDKAVFKRMFARFKKECRHANKKGKRLLAKQMQQLNQCVLSKN